MKTALTRCLLLAAALAVLAGCAADSALKKLPRMPGLEAEPNHYFYFLQAQDARRRGQLDKAVVLMRKAIEKDPDSLYLRRELATIHLQNKEDERALEVLEEVLKTHPEDIRSLIIYGGIHQVRKEYPQAARAYEKVLELDPENERVYTVLAGLYLEQRQPEQARRVLEAMLAHFPDSFNAHYMLGRTHLDLQQAGEAEKHFKRAIEIAPGRLEPRLQLLELYQRQNDPEAAARMAEEIMDQDPDNVRAALELALHLIMSGQDAQGREMLVDLGRRSESEFDVVVEVARLYLDTKRYAEAAIVVDGLLAGAPESSELHHLAGIAKYGLKRPSEAVAHFRKVAPDSRFYEDAVVHAAFILHEEQKTQEAIGLLRDAIERQPDNAEFLYYLGTMYEETEDFDQALVYLKRAVEAAPEEAKYHFRLGVVLDKSGDKEACIASMRRVIALDPKHANALNYLGYTFADLGRNLQEAESLIKEALKYKPDDGYITDSLGWVYYKQGKYEQALTYLQRAASIVPDDPIILEHLGDAFLKLGDEQNALKYYRQALSKKEKDRQPLEEKIRRLSSGD